ncbi:carbohydrate ABC transporter permease [Alkalispirochaeta alkalica]|uniref:carbohydrate ABC transporter permease n=1 Tax=Alkalispirochaeta alkalica TaxID=46356 RepID=UPI001C037576|nr:sugar ABC transporter permease [Alkalispirochaeta alkalica]
MANQFANTVARIKKYWSCYVFIAPFFLLFFVFQFFPILWSFWLSFRKWNGLGPAEFVGLQNYIHLLTDRMFLNALGNTAIYWASGILIMIPIALVIAGLLNYRMLFGRNFYKTITFLPYITATVAVGLIFGIMFDYNSGLINQIIARFGGDPLRWLNSTKYSKIPVISLFIWRLTPWFTMILYTGLLNIPLELYEAATIDGANILQKFRKITVPSLSHILLFCFITVSVESWKIFSEPYILTRGGPGSSSLSIFQYLYVNGFTIFKLGYASAIGYVLTFILFAVSAMQFRLMNKWVKN